MMTHGFGYGPPRPDIEIRFQDLPDEVQDRIVRCFEKNLPPDGTYPGLTAELLRRWYVDRAVYKFWVSNRHIRTNKKAAKAQRSEESEDE
jgi:hypothetical protein